MAFPPASALFDFALAPWQTYALFFLLGSFTVASLSDLRRLSAQVEFLEVWIVFILGILVFDLYELGWRPDLLFALKWGLIVLLSLLSWERVGPVFRLARADVAACAALASLLAPGFIVLFWILLKFAAFVERPVLSRGRNAYPFLPVVTTASVLVLVVAWVGAPLVRQGF